MNKNNEEKAKELAALYGSTSNYIQSLCLQMAEWKDEQFAAEKAALIDNVCNWLEEHLYDDEYTFRDNEGTWVDTYFITRAIKKAMKESN